MFYKRSVFVGLMNAEVSSKVLLLTFKLLAFQVPTLLDRQGAQLLAVAFFVVSRTWVSDRIASLNGILFSLL